MPGHMLSNNDLYASASCAVRVTFVSTVHVVPRKYDPPPPPPTTNEVNRKGGHNRERKFCILCFSPPAFSTNTKIAKRGAYLRDTTVLAVNSDQFQSYTLLLQL